MEFIAYATCLVMHRLKRKPISLFSAGTFRSAKCRLPPFRQVPKASLRATLEKSHKQTVLRAENASLGASAETWSVLPFEKNPIQTEPIRYLSSATRLKWCCFWPADADLLGLLPGCINPYHRRSSLSHCFGSLLLSS